ncbi:MAG: hypothetical protein ACF8MF_01125 [Phycisphaerales bacterium JB052]
MRIYALIALCFMVALMSGLALFWSMTTKTHELWLDGLFILALLLTLVFLLSLIKRAASDSLVSSLSKEERIQKDDQPSAYEQGNE